MVFLPLLNMKRRVFFCFVGCLPVNRGFFFVCEPCARKPCSENNFAFNYHFRCFIILSRCFKKMSVVKNHLSNPKPGHTTGRSDRGGARRGNGAARGWIGRDAVRSIRQEDNPRSCPPANREHSLERLFGSTNNLIRIQN